MESSRKTESEKDPSRLPDDWREMKLGDAPIEIIDGDRGTNYPKQEELFNQSYCLFLNAKSVTGTGFSFLELNFITKEKDETLRKGKLNRNDVVLTTRGTVGNVAFYNDKVPFENVRINSGMVIIRPNGIDPQFSYQLFKFLKNHFLSFSSGSAQPQLPIKDMQEIPIILPPLPEQKAIAEVLSSLDDKIDLLHRQNKTLENIAQTLFRQWFVEEVDDDWEEVKLEKFVRCTTGHSYRSSELQPSSVALVTLKNFARDGSFRMDGYKEFVGKFKEKHITKQGDLVVSHTDITQEADIIGNPALVVHPAKYETLVITMDLMKVESVEEHLSKEFLFYLFKSRNFKGHCSGCSNGTTVLHMSRKAIPSYRFKIPNKGKIIIFTQIVKPQIEKVFSNIFTISTLENLRDTLLPKLMTGNVRVNTLENTKRKI